MMINIYIVIFLLCLVIDRVKGESKYGYWFLVTIVLVVLCFGYMVGTDWRNYELLYNGTDDVDSLVNLDNDISFKAIMKTFQRFLSDFWIFNALMKIVFIHSLILFFKQYTDKPWIAFAISLQFTTLFMVIDCPMRFMMGMTYCQYGIVAFLNNKKLLSVLCGFVAITCHLTILLVILIWLTRPVAKNFVKLPSAVMLLLYVVSIILTNMTSSYNEVLSLLFGIDEFSKYGSTYGEGLVVGGIYNFGVITRFVALLFPVFLKSKLIEYFDKKGEDIVYFGCICAYLGLFLGGIPTAFRINSLNVFYSALAMAFILKLPSRMPVHVKKMKRKMNNIQLIRVFIILFISISIWRNTDSYKYQPYSNSIPYIITDHLPYSYRSTYNINNFQE